MIEVVVIIAIIGIWGLIAVPRFAGAMAHHRAEAAATRIVRDLNLIRTRARVSSFGHKAIFDPDRDRYRLNGPPSLSSVVQLYVVDLTAENYGADLVSVDFGGDYEIVYDGYGEPDSGGTLVLVCGNYTRTVIVDADSGVARIDDSAAAVAAAEDAD